MKKFLDGIQLIGKVFFLAILLMVGWAFVTITNLIKGKETEKSTAGIKHAHADAPSCASCDTCDGGGGKGASTPFLAYFDGKTFRLENDILFGRPKSYYHDFEVAKFLYEDGRISPDLYKITSPVTPIDSVLRFQIQEIETEESFIKWLRLKRVVHPKGSTVIVDSEYRKYHTVDTKKFISAVHTPYSVEGADAGALERISNTKLILNTDASEGKSIMTRPHQSMKFTFSGLKPNKETHLVVKSWFRDWVLGLEEEYKNPGDTLLSSISKFAAFPLVFALAWFLGRRGMAGGALALPYLVGSGSMSLCSFGYEYRDANGTYRSFAVSEPRAWHYNTEVIEIPKEAVQSNGGLTIRITSSKRHALGFIGAVQDISTYSVVSNEEELPLTYAHHQRLNKDVSKDLSNNGAFVHTVPGDIIDLEFSVPKSRNNGEETYLMQASGFYTSLRKHSARLAGNWRERLSPEARQRLANAPFTLKKYQ